MPEIKALDAPPAITDAQEKAILSCVRGQATPQQAATAMAYILNDLCGLSAIEPANLTEAQAGFTRGRRWVAMHIARIGKLALWAPAKDEE